MPTLRRPLFLASGAGLVAVLASACSSSTSPDRHVRRARVQDCEGPATSLPATLASTLPPRSPYMQPNTRWANLAERVPGGFAGALFENGKTVLLLVHPEDAAAAKAALAPLLPEFDIRNATVRSARWDYAQLVDWYTYLTLRTDFGSTPGLTMSSAAGPLDANRVDFGVLDAAAQDRLIARLSQLDLPCDLVVVEVTGPMMEQGR